MCQETRLIAIPQLLTFLIAGHETTSGMLSFATYYLLKSPEAMRKLHQEIDDVCGDRPVQLDDLSRLPYVNGTHSPFYGDACSYSSTAVMRETLRLAPTASSRAMLPNEDTTLGGGKWAVKKSVPIVIHTFEMQRDPRVWGEDVSHDI